MRGFRVVLAAVATSAAALLLAGSSALGYAPAPLSSWVVSGGSLGGGTVQSIAVSGSTAYLGGNFSYIGPETGSAASLDTATGALSPSWPAITGSVYAIVSDGNNGWYVGGAFNSIGTTHHDNLVHILANGSIDAGWQASTNGPVRSLLLSGATLYVGGAFTKAITTDRLRLAAFTASTGALVSGFSVDITGTNAFVWSMAIFGSNLYIGGNFSQVDGQTRNNAAAVATTDGDLDNWNPNVTGTVYAVASNSSTIYLGGVFTAVNGEARFGLAAVGATNGTPTSWSPNPTPQGVGVYSLAVTGVPALVYVGGAFSNIGGQARAGLAAISSTTGFATSWNPETPSGVVFHLAVGGDGTIYAAGAFQFAGGTSRDNVVGLNPTTGVAVPGFAPIVGGPVYALAANLTKVAVGGEFRTASNGAGQPSGNPVRRYNVGAINLTTGQPTSFAPYTDDTVNAVAVSGSRIYVGGLFKTVNGSDGLPLGQDRIAAFDATNGDYVDWAPAILDGRVNTLAVLGSGASATIYAGGTFTSILDVTRNRLAAFDADGLVTDWNPDMDHEVNAIALSGTTLFAGGKFTTVNGGTSRNHLAAFDTADPNAGAVNWDPNVDGEVNAVAVSRSGGTLYAGGSFTQVNGATARSGAAAFETGVGGGEFRGGTAQQAPGTVTAWNPHLEKLNSVGAHAPGIVRAIAPAGTTVYLGGDFDFIGDCSGACLQGAAGAVTATNGAALATWLPKPNATVNAIALSNQGVLIGGPFTAVGYPRPGAPFLPSEAGAIARGGFAAFRGLPEPPTSVTASPLNGSASVAFTPPPLTLGLSLSYTVTSSPGGLTATGSTSPILIGGLTNGVPYTFTITSKDGALVSQPSAASDAVTPSPDPVAPTAPLNVAATPGNASGEAIVSFSAPASNGGAAITDYTVTSNPVGGTAHAAAAGQVTVTGLTNGQSYTFTVTATNSIGTGPPSSPSNAVIPRAVPGQPTNVAATAGNGQVSIGLTVPDDGGAAITGYVVTVSPGGQTVPLGTTLPLIVTGLTNGVSYTFTVQAANAAGTGPASASSSAVTPHAPPGAPTGVTAMPGNGTATVNFTAPVDNGGIPITSYRVISSPDGHTMDGVQSPITVPGLTNGVSYTFRVRAINALGEQGPQSSPSNAVTPAVAPPAAPTGVSGTPLDSAVSVAFIEPAFDGFSPITGYTVTSSGGQTGTGTGTPITVDGLSNGTAYTFTVVATNAANVSSAPSAASSAVTPRTVPGVPTNAAAMPGDGQATVTFTPPASNGGAAITGYTVTSSPGGLSTSGPGSGIIVPGLTNGVSYTFTVKATNVAGNGPSSTPSNAVTPGAPVVAPGAPTGATASPGNAQASVAFTAPTSDGGSAITSYTVTSAPGGFSASGPASPIFVPGLTNGVSYTFTVRATNSAGPGPASAPSNAVTPSVTFTAPGAPTGVTATPGNAQAVITFTAPLSDGNTAITLYTVTSSGGQTATGTSSPIVIGGLTNNTSYTFTVKATNGAGTGPASAPSGAAVPEAGERSQPPNPPAPTTRPAVPDPPAQTGPRKPPPHH